MSEPERKYKLWLTVEVPDVYCDDFVTAAEDGFTPMDCLLESIREEAVVVLMLHGDESGPDLTSHAARIIEAHAEPIPGAFPPPPFSDSTPLVCSTDPGEACEACT